MKYVAVAVPSPSKGMDFSKEIDQVVPDQSLTLQEILERFTRGEEMDVAHDGEYDEGSDVDLEKLGKSDLVDKAEYVEKLKDVQAQYEAQEKDAQEKERLAKEKAAKDADEKRIRIAARKYAKEKFGGQHSST